MSMSGSKSLLQYSHVFISKVSAHTTENKEGGSWCAEDSLFFWEGLHRKVRIVDSGYSCWIVRGFISRKAGNMLICN